MVERGVMLLDEGHLVVESYPLYEGPAGKDLMELFTNVLRGGWELVKESFGLISKTIEAGQQWLLSLNLPLGHGQQPLDPGG